MKLGKENILSCLKKNQNVVVVSNSQNHEQTMIDLHKAMSKKFKRICMVTIHKAFSILIKKFQEEGIDYSNYYFIDCISEGLTKVKDSKQCIYVPSPAAMTKLSITIEEVRKTHGIDLMIFDNISSLLIYNDKIAVLQFLNFIMTKTRQTNTKAIYSILQKDMKESMEDISLFADAVIES